MTDSRLILSPIINKPFDKEIFIKNTHSVEKNICKKHVSKVDHIRRNLNESFGDLLSEQEYKSFLNYSISNDEEQEDNPLVIKFKLSQSNPKVILTRLSPSQIRKHTQEMVVTEECTPKMRTRSNSVQTNNSIRKSARQTKRVSYVEIISPTKYLSCDKRGRSKTIDEEFVLYSPARYRKNSDNNENETKTPSKKSRNSKMEISAVSTPCRRSRRIKTVESPVKMEVEETQTPTKEQFLGKRKIRTPKRHENDQEQYSSPTKSRRIVQQDDVSQLTDNIKNISLLSPQKSAKKSLRQRKDSVKQTETPKNIAKLIRDGVITPSMHCRQKAIPNKETPLMKARSQLHVSYVPNALPCREKEYSDVYNFLEGKLLDECGG